MTGFISICAIVMSSALIYSAPLIFTALGGTFSERSGTINVGIIGPQWTVNSALSSPWKPS